MNDELVPFCHYLKQIIQKSIRNRTDTFVRVFSIHKMAQSYFVFKMKLFLKLYFVFRGMCNKFSATSTEFCYSSNRLSTYTINNYYQLCIFIKNQPYFMISILFYQNYFSKPSYILSNLQEYRPTQKISDSASQLLHILIFCNNFARTTTHNYPVRVFRFSSQ